MAPYGGPPALRLMTNRDKWYFLETHLRAAGDPDRRVLTAASASYLSGAVPDVSARLPRTPSVLGRKDEVEEVRGLRAFALEGQPQGLPGQRGRGGTEIPCRSSGGSHAGGPRRGSFRVNPGGELLLRVGRGSPEVCDDTFEVIHGGTHGVGYNPRNKVRDPLMGPGLA